MIISKQRYRDDEVDGEHLSPPSTSTSRLSDSDTPSECDLRRHHSLSSLASSSSPPPPHEVKILIFLPLKVLIFLPLNIASFETIY